MSNSALVTHTKLSPNCNSPRNKAISKITIHHMAGNASVEQVGIMFFDPARQGSSNYGVDNRGNVGLYVEEKNRAWTSSSGENDHQAVTIEVANDGGAPDWHVSDTALAKTIELCVDICKRNGIAKLNYTGDKTGNLTRHNMFAATACPGPYLQSKFPYIADEVNKQLEEKPVEKPIEKAPVLDNPDYWAADAYKRMSALGVVSGGTGSDPMAHKALTRQEAFVLLDRLYSVLRK